MGGVLRLYLEAGSDVTVLYLTDGRHDGSGLGFSKKEMIEIRRREAESMGKWYRIKQIFWPIEDTCLTNDEETVSRMIRVLKDLRPGVIYLPSFFDHHFDHFTANTVLAESLKRLSDFQVNIAGYEVWDNIPFPNYIVDISACFAEKKKMLSYYTTPLKKVNYINLCDYRNALHYTLYVDPMKNGRAEAFCYWDSDTYQELYRDYLGALKKFKSNLASRVR
jgi:LmbE family N-acetylglucosaminyl deacetylase